MQAGEILRRTAFVALDKIQGGKLDKIKKVNKREIVEGVTKEYVDRRIGALLDYAGKHSEYYRELKGVEDITRYPVMTKMEYNQNKDRIICDTFQDKKDSLFRLSTSGSTGAPFTVLCDGDKMNRVNMNFISFMELNGFRMGMKRGEFRVWIPGKNVISKWKSFKNNLIMIDISNMGDEALASICEKIRRERIQVLVIYSSALIVLANYLKRKNVDISKWDVEMVFAMGEALPQPTYDLVKEIFGFSPVRSYGNNENGFLACQVGEEDRYTVDLYNFYIEMLSLDSDDPVKPGELGRIVVTDFYNKAFPMIRYDTGDTGIYQEVTDEKGRIHGYFTEISVYPCVYERAHQSGGDRSSGEMHPVGEETVRASSQRRPRQSRRDGGGGFLPEVSWGRSADRRHLCGRNPHRGLRQADGMRTEMPGLYVSVRTAAN